MGLFSKKSPTIETKIIEDPIKTAVSNPLSAYLASQIGKGLPSYEASTGKSLYEPFDSQAYNTYQNFLSIKPDEWYTKAIQEPTMKAMREEIPLISENWAGGLRGSGHFADVEDYMSDTAETIAEGRYTAELQIPQAQFNMAQSYVDMKNKEKAVEYADWLKSLPEMNPNLDRALQFLAGPSGRDVVTYQNPGSSGKGGLLGGTIGMAIGALLALPTGGMSVVARAALGGAIGGSLLNE